MGGTRTFDKRHTNAGARMREWRLHRQRTQRDVASDVGITQASLSNYETGKRELPLTTVLAVAAALDITVGDLLDEVEDVIVLEDSRLAQAVRVLVDRPDVVELLARMPSDKLDHQRQSPSPPFLRSRKRRQFSMRPT